MAAMEQQVNLNEAWARLLTYNGGFPGPTIRTRKGDQLRVLYKSVAYYGNADGNVRIWGSIKE